MPPTRKNYILDTNVLIENPYSIRNLQNGDDNTIHIPYHVLVELNTLKTNPRLRHIVSTVVDVLLEHRDRIVFIRNDASLSPFTEEIVDNYILKEIQQAKIEDPILVTNDRILRLQASLSQIQSEEFRDSRPFESESQLYTGFVDNGDDPIPNSFSWADGKPVFHSPDKDEPIHFTLALWNVKPRTPYQNLALYLMQCAHVDLVSVQSEAGFGKTYLALAAALYLVLEKAPVRQNLPAQADHRTGREAGVPARRHQGKDGAVRALRFRPHKQTPRRPPGQQALPQPERESLRYNPKKFEVLPLAYIRA